MLYTKLKPIIERTEISPRALDQDRSRSHPHLRPVGTELTGGSNCCSFSGCPGQVCSSTHTSLRQLGVELVLFDSTVRSLTRGGPNSLTEVNLLFSLSAVSLLACSLHPTYRLINMILQSQDREGNTVEISLQWAIDIVRSIHLKVKDQSSNSQPRSPTQDESQPDTSLNMKRGHPYPGQEEDQSFLGRQYIAPHRGYSESTQSTMNLEQSRENLYRGQAPPKTNSPHLTASSSSSNFMPSRSPMHAPQPTRPGMLPSPSSLNYPNPHSLPPISSPSAAAQNSAQTSHLHDLQHQISLKTLALQTLQREYDSLLQKLERQRTKCATLEKKFEVSDVEINTLTEDREMLQAQNIALETQVEELQQIRDETRRQLIVNGAQYMRIMEMANLLQAQSAEDKKRWEAEKAGLQQRITVLEEAMVTGAIERDPPPPSTTMTPSVDQSTTALSSTSFETLNVLRNEIGRLRERTQTLEAALRTMREESVTIQEAAKQLLESGSKMEQATKGALS
jgi:hypothetical protein